MDPIQFTFGTVTDYETIEYRPIGLGEEYLTALLHVHSILDILLTDQIEDIYWRHGYTRGDDASD